MNRYLIIALLAILISGAFQSTIAKEKPAKPSGLVIKDADGDVLGPVLHVSTDLLSALVKFQNYVLEVRRDSATISLQGGWRISAGFHEKSDCSDGPYYPIDQFLPVGPSLLVGFDEVLFVHNEGTTVIDIVEAPTGPPVVINVQYVTSATGACVPESIGTVNAYISVVVLTPDILAGFPPPYTLEAE